MLGGSGKEIYSNAHIPEFNDPYQKTCSPVTEKYIIKNTFFWKRVRYAKQNVNAEKAEILIYILFQAFYLLRKNKPNNDN